MRWKFVFLVMLMILNGSYANDCDIISLPAIEDVYIDFWSERVYDEDLLKCEMDPISEGWPVATLVKFNVSDIDIDEDYLGILVLKAKNIEKQSENEPGVIALFPVSSNWTEISDFVSLSSTLGPSMSMIEDEKNIDYSGVGIRFDNGDRIFSFEVSKYIKEHEEDELSFMLVAINGDIHYLVEFGSHEGKGGPYILLMPHLSNENGCDV